MADNQKNCMKILIAEDDPYSRHILQRRLEKWGYDVDVARDGNEAWEKFKGGNHSIVISDWMMPGMDGLELIRRIRSQNGKGYVYTILLTARDRKEDLILGIETGADEYLTKPLDADELRVRLNTGERIVQLEKKLAARNRELEYANQRMRSSLEAAANIQTSLLPQTVPQVEGMTFAWTFRPCQELAGDIFNVFPLGEHHIGFYLLDVSGHGVPAALLSVTLSRILNPRNNPTILTNFQKGDLSEISINDPVEVVGYLNRQFPLEVTTEQYFTLIYGIIDLRNMQMQYVSAGHPGMIYLPVKGKPSVLEVVSFPIGFYEEASYESHVLQLEPGDRLFLYSDGVIEVRRTNGELYGKSRLLQLLVNHLNEGLEDNLQFLLDELHRWSGSELFEDDLTVLAMEITR
ncbi:MAG: SpoIIE family protein phosphatase [Calditrichia bacterium]